MPAKVKATSDAAQVVSTELSEMKDIQAVKPKMIRTADKQPSQQFNSSENKVVNNICEENLQTPKQTAETNSLLSAKIRNKYQTQSDAYVIYPQPYQSYVAPPPIHAMSVVPGATTTTTTIPPQQQHVTIQCQTQLTPPYQVAYQPPMNSCEGDPAISNEQPYEHMSQPLQTCTEAQFYQYGWQYHSPPSVMSPYQPYPDQFQQFQQATLRTPYGCTPVQGVSDSARQHSRYGGQHPRDTKSSSIACPMSLEYNCNWNCMAPPSRSVAMARKESVKNTHKASSIPSSTIELSDRTRTTKSGNDFTKVKAIAAKEQKNPDLVLTQSLSTATRPSGSVRPTDSGRNREWYRRENNLSSDSGWLSDNSSSGKDEGEIVVDDAVASPTINEIGNHFQRNLCLENNTALSSTDESSYQESQTSSISSQCPSTSSDDNEQQQQLAPTIKKHQHQQPRIMRAIPSRFVNLLHAAAENAAQQRKRLEGYPLFRQMFFQRRYYEDQHQHQQQDQVCGGPEMQQAELSLTNQYNQSWYFPAGGYMQFQYHQNPASYVQGQYPQGAGLGPYNQVGYSQGHQGNGCYVQTQQGPGGCLQGSYNQGVENYVQNQYNQGSFCYTQPSAVYMCSDQQCGQEYCPAAQAVPVYIIQMDNPDVANNCTLYNADYISQEKQTQGYACPSNPSYAIPAPVPVQ